VRGSAESGAASIEQAGLVLLVALLMVAAISAFAGRPSDDAAHQLGAAIARKLRCAPRLPGPCWRDVLTEAYGRPVAGAVRALAPRPAAIRGPAGRPLAPVDFRYCRRESCAVPSERAGLTISNRRMTVFTSVIDRRRAGGVVEITYWLYRPEMGWSRVRREASSAYVADHASTPLLQADNPRLVPLETLPGRNHYEFPAAEEPPWRWQLESVYPG
jgi:Flp pilus assembly pilin Flp